MSASINFNEEKHDWGSKNEKAEHKSKKQNSLQLLLSLFEEACLTGTFGEQFYIAIIDPLTYQLQERSIASICLNALGTFVIFDRKNSRCYYPTTIDSASYHALELYCDDSVEMISLSAHAWETASDHFKEHTATFQASINDKSVLEFYEELARRKKEENAKTEREQDKQQQQVFDMSIKELAALLMRQQGKNRLAKLRHLLEEFNKDEYRQDEQKRKEIEEMKDIIKIEIDKEELKRSHLKDHNKNNYIKLTDDD